VAQASTRIYEPRGAPQHENITLDVDTTIVGAGPYGLSIAAHLRARGNHYELLGTPLESWRKFMPEGMVLKSEPFASNLWDPQRRFTLQRFFASRGAPYQPVGRPLPLTLFLEYADWFRQQAVGDPRDTRVVQLGRANGGFCLRLADGSSFTTRRVILATGHMAFRVVPPELAALAEPLVLHSTRIGDVASYANRDVCVIGAGQSALETAALLCEAGARVRVLVRKPQVEWNSPSKPRPLWKRMYAPDAGVGAGWKSMAISELPRVFRWYFPADKRHRFVRGSYGPSGAWWLRDRIEGRLEFTLNAQVQSAQAERDGVQLVMAGPKGTSELHADHVIACTGFRVDIDQIGYLEPALRKDIVREAAGIPALNSHFESSIPGLFIVGVASAPVFGPIMRFMYGAKHAAPVLMRRLA
jgi:thioredoxin reductase